MHKFKIIANPENLADSSVTVDGKELRGVTKVFFTLAPNDRCLLSLEVIGLIEVEGKFKEEHILQVEGSQVIRRVGKQ